MHEAQIDFARAFWFYLFTSVCALLNAFVLLYEVYLIL